MSKIRSVIVSMETKRLLTTQFQNQERDLCVSAFNSFTPVDSVRTLYHIVSDIDDYLT